MKIKPEIRFIWTVLRPHRPRVFLFLAGSLLTSCIDGISIGLLIPLLHIMQGTLAGGETSRLLQTVIRILGRFPEHQLLISLGFVAVSILIKNVFLGLTFAQGAGLSNRVTADLRKQAVERLLTVRIDFHHQSKSGELLDKTLTHTQWLREWLMSSIQIIVFASMFLVLLTILLILSWPLSLLLLALGSVAMGLMSWYLRRLPKLGERTSRASRTLTQILQENLSAVFLIQSHSQEKAQITSVFERIESYRKADNRLTVRSYWVQPINEILGVMVIVLLLVGSTFMLPQSYQLDLPQLLPFLYVLIRMVQTLKILNDSRGIVRSRQPYLKQVHDLLREDNKPFLTDGKDRFPGLEKRIVFEKVCFAYPFSQSVLDGISFSIPAGKTTAIVGRSGSGKSTLTHLLLRFYDPNQGRILVDGQPLTTFQIASYRKKIGVVTQENFLFHSSVKTNIAFGMETGISDDQIFNAAKKAGAHAFIRDLPEGYDTILGDRGVKLSGGERQRIAIARAILKDPEILILDEATSALDAITEQQIHDALISLGPERTFFIVAHRASTVQNADQIIVLKDGAVVETGTPEELLHLSGEYAALMRRKENGAQ